MQTKMKIHKIFYTWHPDFIDHGDGTYETLKTGKWVVEWSIKYIGNNFCCHNHKAVCKTEAQAKKLCKILTARHGKDSPYIILPDDDIALQNGDFVRENGVYKIIGKDGGTKITYQRLA